MASGQHTVERIKGYCALCISLEFGQSGAQGEAGRRGTERSSMLVLCKPHWHGRL